MANWEKREQVGYEWVKNHMDPNAILLGGSNSKNPDILLSDGTHLEIKSRVAQCGQFTESTAHKYLYSNEVQEYFMGKYNPEELLNSVEKNYYLENHKICKDWVYNYYKNNKEVIGFIEVSDNFEVTYYSFDEYFNTHSFSCTYRRKKSGSSDPSSWVNKYLPLTWEYKIEGKKWKVKDLSLIGQQIKGYNTKGTEKIISVEANGFIRILSDTYTPTWIFNVK